MRALVAVFGVCLVVLLAGYALKTVCPPTDGRTYPPLCYSDITALYESRGLDAGVVPYLDFPAGGSYADAGFLEYPVGTGAVMAAAAALTESSAAYLAATAVVLGAIALVSALLLTGLVGLSAMKWAAAPLLGLYAFHNWDLLAVGCVVAGCVAQARGRPGWAGAWFGLGAAAKLYPALFVAPLVLERLWERDLRGAARATLAGGAALLVPNVLVALANLDGWWATYAFHSGREADLGSVWPLVLPADASARSLNIVSSLAMLICGVAVLAFGWRRAAREGAYPFLPMASVLVIVFLLFSKVASPQYALWLLPSLVLLQVGWRWWVAWNAVAAVVYLVGFGVGLDGYAPSMAPTAIMAAAGARAVTLVALGLVMARASPIIRPRTPVLAQRQAA